jgi:hypothetical protein
MDTRSLGTAPLLGEKVPGLVSSAADFSTGHSCNPISLPEEATQTDRFPAGTLIAFNQER